MKPSAFNSIDTQNKDLKSLQSLAEWYTLQIHKLYMDLIQTNGGKDARSVIKVDAYFKKTKYQESTLAGNWAIRKLLLHFEKEDFPEKVQKLNDFFIKKCECANSEDVLNFLSLKIMFIGQENADLEKWIKSIGDFSSCETVKSRIPS